MIFKFFRWLFNRPRAIPEALYVGQEFPVQNEDEARERSAWLAFNSGKMVFSSCHWNPDGTGIIRIEGIEGPPQKEN